MDDLVNSFFRHFSVALANTPELTQQAYALRYQVYCLENAFEDAAQFPDELEVDQYDCRSVQSLVSHKQTGTVVGTVRLVLHDEKKPQASFPVEPFCRNDFEGDAILKRVPRESLAEISRFAISKSLKRESLGKQDLSVTASIPSGEASTLPMATLGLFRAIVEMSAAKGVNHWLAAMQPTLLRHLSRFGIYFQPIGPRVEYHGRRQPVIGVIDEVLAGIHRERPDVWALITDYGALWPLNDEVTPVISGTQSSVAFSPL